MKAYLLLFIVVVSLCVGVKSSQAEEFSLDKYKEFLETNKDANYNTIQTLYPQNTYLYYSKQQYSIDDAVNFKAIKTVFVNRNYEE